MMKILVIVPAYNESENIVRVVSELQEKFSEYDYVVVNDGSRDDTAAICVRNGFHLIDLPINLGLSGAFQAGMLYAYRRGGYDYVIQYDGDGQHNPRYIADMIREARQNRWQVTIGSRFATKKKPFSLRMLGSNIIELCILLTTGKRIKDPTSGMRLYDRSMIKPLATLMNYTPEPNTIAFLLRCGVSVGEVQVEMNERTAGESYLNLSNSIKYMFHECSAILLVQWFRKKIALRQGV